MERAELFAALRAIAGARHVLTRQGRTLRYRRGFRTEAGLAAAVVRPGSLVQLWRIVVACRAQDAIIVMQAANTGLTGGSTPPAADLGRPVIVINTGRLSGLHLIDGGQQIVCLPGTSLNGIERALRPLGREPHSVIGSSCLGASAIGGICNNSGGALIRRGPAYTEMALYARADGDGNLRLVNDLGIDLGSDPETMLDRLDRGAFEAGPPRGAASDPDYATRVRDVDAPTPARFNADTRRLRGVSGSAGRVVVFAARLDSFPAETDAITFCCATNDPANFTTLRRAMLGGLERLPISAEYIHRDALDTADSYGKDLFHAIRLLGTDRLPSFFAAKSRIDALFLRIGIRGGSDRVLQKIGAPVLPGIFTGRLRGLRDRFQHHLILKVSAGDRAMIERMLGARLCGASGAFFECTSDEATKAGLHRYVTAGAAIRMQMCNPQQYGSLVSLDVALPRNATAWDRICPPELEQDIAAMLHYGHFFCHVFHRDYLLRPGADPARFKHRMLAWLDRQQVEYPAEHNVGRQYRAKPAQADFFRQLDPTNSFNPGIGMTPAGPGWSAQQG